jgi:hypothetical protein
MLQTLEPCKLKAVITNYVVAKNRNVENGRPQQHNKAEASATG